MYNGSRFVIEQLESILSQASAEDEILILDDRSTDESYTIVKAMEPRHAGLKVMCNELNVGVAKTFSF